MLRPIDIHNREFKHVFRGYSAEEVDSYIDKLVTEYESLFRENTDLKALVSELKEQVDKGTGIEDTLNETLRFVKETSEEAKVTAEREADRILRKAQAHADEILTEAKEKVRREELQFKELQRKAERFRRRFKDVLESYLAELAEDADEISNDSDSTRVIQMVQEAAATSDNSLPESS